MECIYAAPNSACVTNANSHSYLIRLTSQHFLWQTFNGIGKRFNNDISWWLFRSISIRYSFQCSILVVHWHIDKYTVCMHTPIQMHAYKMNRMVVATVIKAHTKLVRFVFVLCITCSIGRQLPLMLCLYVDSRVAKCFTPCWGGVYTKIDLWIMRTPQKIVETNVHHKENK